MSTKRQNYTPSFKAKVALEAIREEATLAQLSSKYKVNVNLISRWKSKSWTTSPVYFVISNKTYPTQMKHVFKYFMQRSVN